ALTMLRPAICRADGTAHHHRDAQLPVRHVPHLRGLVDKLVHALEEEVRILEVRDRPHPHQCGSDGGTRNRLLTDRRVDDAVAAEFLWQPQVHAERAAEPTGDADVFADEKDVLVVTHLLGDRFAQRLGDRDAAFGRPRRGTKGQGVASLPITVAYASVSASSARGSGEFLANSMASSSLSSISASVSARASSPNVEARRSR